MTTEEASPEPSRLPAYVFINYAREDAEIAQWIADSLRDEGAEVWMDTSEMDGGDDWQKELKEALWKRQFVVCVVTECSVAPEREWVLWEQKQADLLLKNIIPCVFAGEEQAQELLPENLKSLNAVFFEPDREVGLRKLVNSIRGGLHRYGKRFPVPENRRPDQSAAVKHTFVGRESDLHRFKGLIDNEAVLPTGRRIIGILGMGGIGKTMLAEEMVRRLSFHYPGGVLIESRGGEKPKPAALVMRRWAEWALGKPPDRGYGAKHVTALMNTFGEMLVLIDNVTEEHYKDTKALLDLLPADATRIVTTRLRDVLRGLDAIQYPLAPLSEEDALLLLEERLRGEFAAGLEQDGLSFEEEIERHREALKELAALVEGHPLALDLGIGTCGELDEIPKSVELLKESFKAGVDKFKAGLALEAADANTSLAMSLHRSLSDLERHDQIEGTDWVDRFHALGVFPDGSRFQEELVRAVWGDDEETELETMEALKGLRWRAMLRRERGGLYFNHPVVRAYATGLLNARPQAGEIRARYEHWVVARAAKVFKLPQEEWIEHWQLGDHVLHVAARLVGSVEKEAGKLRRLARSEPLEDAAIEVVRKLPADLVELAMEYAEAVKEFVIRRPELGQDGVEALQLGLVCSRANGNQNREAGFLKRLGGAFSRTNPELARRYFAAGLKLARAIEDEKQVAETLSFFGELERTQAQWDSALELLNQGLEMHEHRNKPKMQAATLKYIGEVHWRRGEFTEALNHYHRAQEIYEKEGNLAGSADILNKKGSVEFNRGNHRDAIDLFEKALEAHKKVGNRTMQAEDKNDMGAAYRYLGEKSIALGLFEEARDIDLEIGNLRHEAFARANRAGVLGDLEEFDVSLREARSAKQVADDVGDPIPKIWALCWEGNALRGLERDDEAEARYREAIELCRKIDNPRGLAGSLGMLAALLADDPGGRGEARELFREAVEFMEEKGIDQALGGRRVEDLRVELERLSG